MPIITNNISDINRKIKDYTIDGECSSCGDCCTSMLPMTHTELKRLKSYVKKHKIKPQKANLPLVNFVDLTCPFRDNKNKKCLVYHIRPVICKQFICNHTKRDIFNLEKNKPKDFTIVNMRKEFK